MDADLVQILLEIKSDTAATRQAIEDLAGPHGRVTVLEESIDSQAKFQKWYNYAIVPVLASLHELARHFGVKI